MIGRIIKRLLYVFGVLGIFLVAIGLGVVIWMWDSHQPADPEWLRMDDRFPVPHGAKVVDKGWIARKGPAAEDGSSTPVAHFAADPGLTKLTEDFQNLLGEKPSMHWMYCARSRIGDDWILSENAIETITTAQLSQLAKAYTFCIELQRVQQRNKEPRMYVSRAIRIEMSELVDAKYGAAVLDVKTRACIKANTEHDPLMKCLARQRPGATMESIQVDWAEVYKLLSLLRQGDSNDYL